MSRWTMPEYIESNPSESTYSIIQKFFPSVPSEDSEDYTDDDDFKSLAEKIDAYKDVLSKDETPNRALKTELITLAGVTYLPDEKPETSTDPVIPDANDPLAKYSSVGDSIRTITEIGGYDVSEDVISINTSQSSGVEEGNQQSTCTVVLNNNSQKYGKLIASYEWSPRVTRIWSKAFIPINTGTGTTIQSYMIFVGFMSDGKYNEETAEVTFGCVGIIGSASYDDQSWSTEDGYIMKMESLLENIEEDSGVGLKLTLKDLRSNSNVELTKQYFAPSDISGSENLRSVAQDSKGSFYYATDYGGEETYVVLTDSQSKTLYIELGDYVVTPGDCSTIFGHANFITTVGGTPIINETMRHIPTPVRNEVLSIKANTESIARYGKIPSYVNHESNLDRSQIDVETDLCDETYKQYIDRDIKVTVANIIPKLLSVVTFMVPDLQTGEHKFIYAGVRKKQVEFSVNGVVTHIECARLDDGEAEEMEAISGDITVTSEGITIGEDYWQFQWENGKWQPYWIQNKSGSIFSAPSKYTGTIPDEVTNKFKPILQSIEDTNDQIDSAWRTKYGNT